MKTILLLVIMAFSSPVFGQDAVIQDTKKSSRKTTGEESRIQKSKQNSDRKSISVSTEIGVGTLFLPLLQVLERTASYADSANKETRCSVFDAGTAVYTSVGDGITITTVGRDGKSSYKFDDGSSYVTTPARQVSARTGGVEERILGQHEVPSFRLMCLSLYADLVERTTRLLLAEKMDIKANNAYGENVFLIPNLQKRVAYLWSFKTFGPNMTIPFELMNYSGSCVVPTSQGLQSGQGDVKCAEWSFNSRGGQLMLVKGGAKWLDQDSVKGRKILFAEANAEEVQNQLQSSKSSYQSKDKSNESSESQSQSIIKK